MAIVVQTISTITIVVRTISTITIVVHHCLTSFNDPEFWFEWELVSCIPQCMAIDAIYFALVATVHASLQQCMGTKRKLAVDENILSKTNVLSHLNSASSSDRATNKILRSLSEVTKIEPLRINHSTIGKVALTTYT